MPGLTIVLSLIQVRSIPAAKVANGLAGTADLHQEQLQVHFKLRRATATRRKDQRSIR